MTEMTEPSNRLSKSNRGASIVMPSEWQRDSTRWDLFGTETDSSLLFIPT
jgi:hypothetical protein